MHPLNIFKMHDKKTVVKMVIFTEIVFELNSILNFTMIVTMTFHIFMRNGKEFWKGTENDWFGKIMKNIMRTPLLINHNSVSLDKKLCFNAKNDYLSENIYFSTKIQNYICFRLFIRKSCYRYSNDYGKFYITWQTDIRIKSLYFDHRFWPQK